MKQMVNYLVFLGLFLAFMNPILAEPMPEGESNAEPEGNGVSSLEYQPFIIFSTIFTFVLSKFL